MPLLIRSLMEKNKERMGQETIFRSTPISGHQWGNRHPPRMRGIINYENTKSKI